MDRVHVAQKPVGRGNNMSHLVGLSIVVVYLCSPDTGVAAEPKPEWQHLVIQTPIGNEPPGSILGGRVETETRVWLLERRKEWKHAYDGYALVTMHGYLNEFYQG